MRTDSPSHLLLLLSRHRGAGHLYAQQHADGISRRPVVPLLITARHLDLGHVVLDHIVAMFREASVACAIGHLNTRAMLQPCCAMTSFWGSSVSFAGRAPDLGFSVQYLQTCCNRLLCSMENICYLNRSIALPRSVSIGLITCFYINLYKIAVRGREVGMRSREESRAHFQIRFFNLHSTIRRPQRHNEPDASQQLRDCSLRCRCRSAPCSHRQRPSHLHFHCRWPSHSHCRWP